MPFLLHAESGKAFVPGTCEDDFNGSGKITLADVVLMGPAYNNVEGDPAYHPRFDLNGDHSVTLSDVVLMGPGYNQSCGGGAFVKAWGQTLYTPSDPGYRFTGVNRYSLLGCGVPLSPWTNADLGPWFAEVAAQDVEVVRLWAFQRLTSGGTDYSKFDNILDHADSYGIRVIPTFENHWSACTEGGNKSATWYASGYLSPYGAYSLSLKNYVSGFVTRYKDDDRIAMWQVMNEAETSNAATLRAFADDIAGDIQAIDPNHIVSFGTLGAGQPGTQGADYKTLHSLASIDICEWHDYHHVTEPIPAGSNLLSTRLVQCAELSKPLFIGEAGIDTAEEGITQQQRADYFASKISAFYAAGGDGYLIWSYRDRDGADSMEYDATDPLAGVVAGW